MCPALVLEKASNSYLAPDLRALPDRHYLAEMTRAVFNAGFNWTVIRNKWDGFEAAFADFDPHRVAFYSDDDVIVCEGFYDGYYGRPFFNNTKSASEVIAPKNVGMTMKKKVLFR